MTLYDRIFALANKMAKNLSKGENPNELEESDLFSAEAKKRMQENLSEETIQANIETLNSIAIEKDWDKVALKLQHQKKSNRSTIYKVAAVAILLFSITYFSYYHTNKTEFSEITETTIIPGTDKALLTLGDGSHVILDTGTNFKNDIVHSNGERLEYQRANTNLYGVFNYLAVPRGGHFQVALADGTLVWLNADTKLKYPVSFKSGEPRIVELLYGEAYFDVSPSTKHNGDTFKVISQGQKLAVVGTEFNIKAYNDELYIYTTLVEGHIQIALDEKLEQLYPSEQTIVNRKTKQLTKTKVDVALDIAWVRGYFNFKNKPLKDIMIVLSRWYDVEILFKSPALENVKFSGLLSKQQNLKDILKGFQNTNAINAYEISNNTITIK